MRILLADNHKLVIDGLAAILDRVPGFEVVARVHNGRDVVEAAVALQPDVAVLAIGLPELNGIDACRRILAERPEVRVLVMSRHRERQYLRAAFQAGVSGYLLKRSSGRRLVEAIRAVVEGRGPYLCPEMAAVAVHDYQLGLRKRGENCNGEPTPREREVLQLVAEGNTSLQIAGKLDISERTVAAHRRRLSAKLDLHSPAALVKYAIRHGLTSADR